MSNHLEGQVSPYLLQHKDNPVDWYPWCEEAFEKARASDKPVFLSIGYSTCHWCHVMAHESFEDEETAEILNKNFISVKVDREERPDIDNIYMSVCEAFNGSGGWPTSIFMTPEKEPFFAGTYFPKNHVFGGMTFKNLLITISDKWKKNREELLNTVDEVKRVLALENTQHEETETVTANAGVLFAAAEQYKKSYDSEFGGFGRGTKFPTPHALIFLMNAYKSLGDKECMDMAEKTLKQMYKGGIFDHIGYGFCRYSTDRYFLVPHFEKMLYDNALLILAYCKAYDMTKSALYLEVAEKTAEYVLREMTDKDGGFYSAQDADSGGKEGAYYLFTDLEVKDLLGDEQGDKFNTQYGITKDGNFEGKNIPNLLSSSRVELEELSKFDEDVKKLYEYRKDRMELRLDDKILLSWNSLMIAAFCSLYKTCKAKKYFDAAQKAYEFIEKNLCDGDILYVSCRKGRTGEKGFLSDYANYIFALISLYEVTSDKKYFDRAMSLCKKTVAEFYDDIYGGFYLYGSSHEKLFFKPKDTLDSAIPSGNSMMALNLVRMSEIHPDDELQRLAEKQLNFIFEEAIYRPTAHSVFLSALIDALDTSSYVCDENGCRFA